MSLRLRTSEWVLVVFFGYIVAIAPFFRDRSHLKYQPLFVFAGVLGFLYVLAHSQRVFGAKAVEIARDWLPIGLTLLAFREMELFVTSAYLHAYETAWIRWDDVLLGAWRLRGAIERGGAAVPFYLELCYFFVYGVGGYCVAVLYIRRRRNEVNRFWIIYLVGTLTAYALFPYFPSQPPRIAFPSIDPPTVITWVRKLNLLILQNVTIHSGVFPSAHVSSAFSCAWAMFLLFPDRKQLGWGLLIYAASVSVATVYGRYHYAADVVTGFGVSLVAALVCLVMAARRRYKT